MSDPIGLERCAVCRKAVEYDANEDATAAWRAAGRKGFVCRDCAAGMRAARSWLSYLDRKAEAGQDVVEGEERAGH